MVTPMLQKFALEHLTVRPAAVLAFANRRGPGEVLAFPLRDGKRQPRRRLQPVVIDAAAWEAGRAVPNVPGSARSGAPAGCELCLRAFALYLDLVCASRSKMRRQVIAFSLHTTWAYVRFYGNPVLLGKGGALELGLGGKQKGQNGEKPVKRVSVSWEAPGAASTWAQPHSGLCD